MAVGLTSSLFLTDFQKFLLTDLATAKSVSKNAVKYQQKLSLYFICVSTLPCEILMSIKGQFETDVVSR